MLTPLIVIGMKAILDTWQSFDDRVESQISDSNIPFLTELDQPGVTIPNVIIAQVLPQETSVQDSVKDILSKPPRHNLHRISEDASWRLDKLRKIDGRKGKLVQGRQLRLVGMPFQIRSTPHNPRECMTGVFLELLYQSEAVTDLVEHVHTLEQAGRMVKGGIPLNSGNGRIQDEVRRRHQLPGRSLESRDLEVISPTLGGVRLGGHAQHVKETSTLQRRSSGCQCFMY